MVVSLGRNHPSQVTGYPDELLESKYVVTRDELLWREYERNLSLGNITGTMNALKILNIIREAP